MKIVSGYKNGDQAFSYLTLLHLRPKHKVETFLNEVKKKQKPVKVLTVIIDHVVYQTYWQIVPAVRCSSLRKQEKPFVVLCLHPVYVWQNK